MKKFLLFLLFLLILAGGAYYYFGVRLYTKALDKGIEKVMEKQDLFVYKGLSIEERNVICLLEVEEFTDEPFIEVAKANDVTEEDMREQATTILYDQIADLVAPIHKLRYDFIIRLIGSSSRTTFDIPFPHN